MDLRDLRGFTVGGCKSCLECKSASPKVCDRGVSLNWLIFLDVFLHLLVKKHTFWKKSGLSKWWFIDVVLADINKRQS